MKEIQITDFENVFIGQVEDRTGGTGCTAFISKKGMPAGIDVRGGGPATRESELINPVSAAQTLHGVVLAGGSAFGLDASGGVMKYLEEQGIGYPVGPTTVPLVCQADIFDLLVGDMHARPDVAMGYQAAVAALSGGNYRDGNYGVGCGASIGKICGMGRAMKSGIGSCAVELGELKVGAVVVVNALGDIFDYKNGRKIGGLLNEDKTGFASTEDEICKLIKPKENKFTGNTTLGVIMTNAKFDKAKLCKIAALAQDGYARSIRPVHTSADGDTIFALSLGELTADHDLVGVLAAEVMSEAIIRALETAEQAYGLPSVHEL